MKHSAGLCEHGREGSAGSVQFTTDGIGTLLGNLADLLVAQVLIRDQEQQAPILLRQAVQGSLNSLPEFLGLKRPQKDPQPWKAETPRARYRR